GNSGIKKKTSATKKRAGGGGAGVGPRGGGGGGGGPGRGGGLPRGGGGAARAPPRHEFDPADRAAVAEAERRFKELTGAGFTAAVRRGEGRSELIRGFDSAAEETLFFPQLKAG